MTREELVRALVEKQGHVSYKNMTDAVKLLSEALVTSLIANERIEIRGFGSFALRHRPSRLARNPKTGVTLNTEPKYAVHFKPGKELKERVNHEQQDVT